jgi:hypothetical protein
MTKRRWLMLLESTGSIAWFAMDAGWMLNLRTLCLVLAVPTVCLNVLAIRFTPRRTASVLVAAAMAAWACMNTLWMTNDFHFVEGSLVAAKAFLMLGALMLGVSLVADRSTFRTLLGRFRRLRVRA